MRDQNFNRITVSEKTVNNKYTRQGDYALIEVTDKDSFPDAKITGKQMLYANILKIGSEESVRSLADMSNGKYAVIETKRLEPQEMPYKLEKKLEKIEKRHNKIEDGD